MSDLGLLSYYLGLEKARILKKARCWEKLWQASSHYGKVPVPPRSSRRLGWLAATQAPHPWR